MIGIIYCSVSFKKDSSADKSYLVVSSMINIYHKNEPLLVH